MTNDCMFIRRPLLLRLCLCAHREEGAEPTLSYWLSSFILSAIIIIQQPQQQNLFFPPIYAKLFVQLLNCAVSLSFLRTRRFFVCHFQYFSLNNFSLELNFSIRQLKKKNYKTNCTADKHKCFCLFFPPLFYTIISILFAVCVYVNISFPIAAVHF